MMVLNMIIQRNRLEEIITIIKIMIMHIMDQVKIREHIIIMINKVTITIITRHINLKTYNLHPYHPLHKTILPNCSLLCNT